MLRGQRTIERDDLMPVIMRHTCMEDMTTFTKDFYLIIVRYTLVHIVQTISKHSCSIKYRMCLCI